MYSNLLIAGAVLLVCAITAKILLGAPEKANKSQKAEIMKQLLALSDGEKKISGAGSPARSRPLSKQLTPPRNGPRKTTPRISQTLSRALTNDKGAPA